MHRLLVSGLVALATTATTTSTANGAHIEVPKFVSPGERVLVTGFRFPPFSTVGVGGAVDDGTGCCGFLINKRARAKKSGRVYLRFRWPRRYLDCEAVGCSKVPWHGGERVQISAGFIDPNDPESGNGGLTPDIRRKTTVRLG